MFRNLPGCHASLTLSERILIGETTKTPAEIIEIVERLSAEFLGKDYHLLLKNCNHFSESLCRVLTGKGIPDKINRISKFGHCLSCILPASIWGIALEEDTPMKKSKIKKLRY